MAQQLLNFGNGCPGPVPEGGVERAGKRYGQLGAGFASRQH